MAITAKTSKQAVIDIINAENSTALTDADISLGTASPVEAGKGPTLIEVTPAAGSKFTGKVTITYNRQPASVSINSLPAITVPNDISKDEAKIKAFLLSDVLSKLPVPFDTGLTIELTMGAEGEVESAKFDCTDHLVLFGEHTSAITVEAPTLEDTLKVTELTSFTADEVKAS
jgi:hypothetical protein